MASSTSNAKAYVDDYYPSFREFKGGLAKLLSSETITKLVDFFKYPISLKEEISKDEKDSPLRMVENMEVRGQIKPHEISALLNACNKLNLHLKISSVKRLFEEYRVMVGDPLTLMSHCSETIALRKIDSESVHKCTMAILGNAAMNEFPIPNLRLHRTFLNVNGGDIILQSGLQFPCPSSVQKIVLNSFGEITELTEEEMVNLLVCAAHAHALMELQLRYFLLPECIQVCGIPTHFIVPKMTDFGRFKERLANLLTDEIIFELASFFMFPPDEINELRHTKSSPRRLMVSLMEKRGKIKPKDISPLLTALDMLEIHRFFPGPLVSWVSYYEAFHLNPQSGRWKSYFSNRDLNHQDYVTLKRKNKGKAQRTKDTEH